MPALGKMYENQMNVVKDADHNMATGDTGKYHFRRENQLYNVIENAGGVPFQLIFGPEPGSGFYRYIGEGVRDLLGVDQQSFTERVFVDMIRRIIPMDSNIPADSYEMRRKFLLGEIPNYKAEVLVAVNGGRLKWIRDCSMPIKDDLTGKVIGSTGILFEISESSHQDEAQRKPDDIDWIKSSFLRNISHEVRTPLNAIIGFTTLLCEPGQEYEKKKEFADIINASSDHLLEIVDNILEISRIDSGSVSIAMKECQPDHVVSKVYDRYFPIANGKKIKLECVLPQESVTIVTDSFKLQQILSNLVSNAVKFTLSGSVEFGFMVKKDEVEFFVTDTGIGIDDDHKELVFTKFYQVESGINRRFPGTGLGLTISRAYAEMIGTNIDLISVLGTGSTFRFKLPLRPILRKII
jgi:signal transduction histidine kinase